MSHNPSKKSDPPKKLLCTTWEYLQNMKFMHDELMKKLIHKDKEGFGTEYQKDNVKDEIRKRV